MVQNLKNGTALYTQFFLALFKTHEFKELRYYNHGMSEANYANFSIKFGQMMKNLDLEEFW